MFTLKNYQRINIFPGNSHHGGKRRVFLRTTRFQRCDFGLYWFKIDKPAFEQGLCHLFEGLIYISIFSYFIIYVR